MKSLQSGWLSAFVQHIYFHFRWTAVDLTHKHTQEKKQKKHRSGTLAEDLCKDTLLCLATQNLFSFIDFYFSKAEASRANMAAVAEQRVQKGSPAATHCFWQERCTFGCGWSMRELTSRSDPTVSLSLYTSSSFPPPSRKGCFCRAANHQM